MPVSSREWHLAARPVGEPKPADFALVTTQVPDPGPGQVLVRNDWMSVDPYMRGRMRDRRSYIAPFALDRAMEGSATAIFPLALSILRDELPAPRLPAAMGMVSSTLAVGAGLALVGAGLLTRGANPDYHYVFLFATILSGLALAAVLLVVPPSPHVVGGRTDWAGAATLAGTLALILLPLSQGNAWGWASARTLGCLGAAVTVGAAWVLTEARTREPLVDLAMFMLKPVVLTNLAGTFLGFGMFTQYIGISSFAQTPAHLAGYGFSASALRASAQYLLPATAASLITGQLIGVFVRRFGPRLPLAVGASCGVLGFTGLAFAHGSAAFMIVEATLTGAAVSSGFATLPAFIAAGVPCHQSGIANGLNSIARSTGSSVASAVIATLLAAGPLRHLPAGSLALPRERQYTVIFLLGAAAFVSVVVIAVFFLHLPRVQPSADAPRPAPATPRAVIPKPGGATTYAPGVLPRQRLRSRLPRRP